MQFQAVCKDKPLTLAPLHDIGLGFLDPSSLPAATSATTGNRWRKQIGRHQSHTISVEFIDRSPPAAATTTGSRGNNRNTPVLPAPMPPSASEALIFGVTTPSGGVNNSPPKKPRPGKPSKTKSAPSVDTAQLAKFIRSASSEQVDIAVESLLGKLSMENVDVISDDITWWASKSEESGRTLGQVVCLVVKSAVENPTQSYAYARLCHKTMTQIGTKVRDEVMISGWNKNATGSLFHTRLLATCQEHFDKDWNVNGATTAIFDRGTVSNEAAHVVSENAEGGVHETEFAGLDSESNDRQAKKQAKRLGLIRFIGELFRVRMVKESIIREYLNKLVAADNPRDQRIEGLCELLKQVGSRLDTPKNRTEMDAYFRCLNERGEGLDTSPHILAMLQVGLLSFVRCTLTMNRTYKKGDGSEAL